MLKSVALVTFAALASFTATVASAAQTPLIDTGYQQLVSTTCTPGFICVMGLPVATAPVTEITNISCIALHAAPGTQIQSALFYGHNSTFITLQSFVIGADSDGNFSFGLVGTTKLFLYPGDTSGVQIGTQSGPSGSYDIQCTVSGYTHT